MRIETIPLVIGGVVALLGLLLLFDAWTPDETVIPRERRNAPRPERNRGGETAIGFGVLCLAAALFGRDSWPYSIVSAIAGTALVLLGTVLNREYVRGLLVRYVDDPDTSYVPPAPILPDAGPLQDGLESGVGESTTSAHPETPTQSLPEPPKQEVSSKPAAPHTAPAESGVPHSGKRQRLRIR